MSTPFSRSKSSEVNSSEKQLAQVALTLTPTKRRGLTSRARLSPLLARAFLFSSYLLGSALFLPAVLVNTVVVVSVLCLVDGIYLSLPPENSLSLNPPLGSEVRDSN